MKLILNILILSILSITTFSNTTSIRLKDISRIIESRDNQLIGYGLVVGLRNTGDSQRSAFTEKALTNL